MRELRSYQCEAIASVRESLRSGKKRPVLQLPTGGGKTVIASEIFSMARDKGKRCVFVVPAKALIDQTVASFMNHGLRGIGVMQADHFMTDASQPIQVATVQTLARRSKPDCDIVLVDEAHRNDKALLSWMNSPYMENVPVIGLSATPWAKGMGKIWDDLIICSTTEKMIEAGYLSPFRVFAPAHPDLSGVGTVAGDYNEKQLSAAMNKDVLVADAVETWIKLGENRPTLCFAVDRAHAKSLQNKFMESGIPCGYIDAFTDDLERKQIETNFARGFFKVVCNVGVLTTGVDWDVRCIVLCRPTKSEILFTQIIGRGLRTAEGKQDCLILDHSDTHTRLGFVTDIHHTSLNTGEKNSATREGKEKLPKECPKCTYLRPAKVSTCPQCGFKPEVVSKIEMEEGELAEITRGRGTKATGPANTIKMKDKWIPLGDFFGQLKQYAWEHGYKEGWAAMKYKDAVGTWPNYYKQAPKMEVSGEVFSWIKSQQIKWAKRKKVEEHAPV